MFFYLCDGKVKDCNKKSCYKNGGECRHTSNAKNRKKEPNTKMVEVGEDTWEMDQKGMSELIEEMWRERC